MASRLAVVASLAEAVRAAAPGTDISVGTFGASASVALHPESPAARAVVDGWDWSDAAQDAREAARVPERKDLRDAAAQAIADIDAYLALANPTNAQVAAQVRRLSQMMRRVIIRLIQID